MPNVILPLAMAKVLSRVEAVPVAAEEFCEVLLALLALFELFDPPQPDNAKPSANTSTVTSIFFIISAPKKVVINYLLL